MPHDNGAHRDWSAVRGEYVEGVAEDDTTIWLTLDQVAVRHGLNANYVRQRASKEGWTDQRAAFQRRIEYKRSERRSTEIARQGAQLDCAALEAAHHGLKLTGERLRELAAFSAARAERLEVMLDDGEGHAPHPDLLPGDPVAAREIEQLGRAATDFYALGIRAIGEAPKVAIEVEQPAELVGEARDARALGILAIMRDHDLLPPELEAVIDVSAGRIRGLTGDGALADLERGAGAAEQ